MRISAAFASLVAGSLLVPSLAFAFRADENRPPEFGRGDLYRVPDAKRQAALSQGAAWQRFVAGHAGVWRVTWDDRAGTPREIVGGSIPLVSPNATRAQVEAASRAFLATIEDLSGVRDAQLKTSVVTLAGDTWHVRFDRVTKTGVLVDGAHASLRVKQGRITLIRLETHPQADAAKPAKVSLTSAKSLAHSALAGFVPANATLASTATSVVVPVAVDGGWEYRPAFKVDTVAGKASRWRSTVDALHGEVLARESLIHYTVQGQVKGQMEPRTVGDTLADLPLPYVRSVVGGEQVDAGNSGSWTWGGDAPASVTHKLSGQFVDVKNDSGAEGSATFSASAPTGNDFTWTTANATQSEIAAYRHANTVRAWALGVTPGNPWLQSQLRVNVLINDECNAYWDGQAVNFFRAGTQCNDTARIADVVYHEFGHGFHQENRVSGIIDGAIGEGTGDFVAATITGSSDVGPFFFKNGDPVREIESNRSYPDDLVGESHEDGLIWAGAMWDLRKALIAKLGEPAGRAAVDAIFAKALQAGPRIDEAFTEVLLADDDDADLGNGTPNQCEIETAFGSHGLSGSAQLFANMHQEVSGLVDGLTDIPVTATPPANIGACGQTISGITLRYKIDGGSTQSISLAAGSPDFTGAIPAPGDGHVVKYWIEVALSNGSDVTIPAGAPDYRYAFYTGATHPIFADDFENGLGDWTHGGTRDDWEVGVPGGGAGDPDAAYSGTHVFGTDVDGDGGYQSSAASWAESPVIDCRGCSGARLRFRRWVTVEDGNWDQTRLLVDGSLLWDNPTASGWNGPAHKDPIWSYEDYDISFVDGKKFTLRFELSSDEGLQYGGWNVDDVEVVSTGAPTNPGNGGGNDGGFFGCSVTTTANRSPLGAALLLVAIAGIVIRRKR